MFRRNTIVLLFLTLCTGAIFAIWPQLDMAVSGSFRSGGVFVGRSAMAGFFRQFLQYLPVLVMAGMVLTWLSNRYQTRICFVSLLARFAPSTHGLVFAGLALALGPGLLVNVGLKDHWSRPRPVHVKEFGGEAEFRPWWRTDGSCRKNCSFVSGEVSGSFWLAAPASLTPPQLRVTAVAAALIIGTVTAILRVAAGGHFLSDVLFAALLTLLICIILYWAIIRNSDRPGRANKS